MSLKLFDKKNIYNAKTFERLGDKILTRYYVDLLSLSDEDRVYLLKNCDGIYTEEKVTDKVQQPQFICPNGVNCAEVIDAIKTIYECNYKQARKTAEFDTTLIDFFYDTERVYNFDMNATSYPVILSNYKAEFNAGDHIISEEEAQMLFDLRDKALRKKAKKDTEIKKQSEPGEEE
ncbi:MAG: hypothetical protein IJS74_00430 [Clostridia bacterium]|nr:hypothetical protein [Clostridia bacterium]